ncbi:LPS assembly lipoprotein LptE [Sediminimonas sp.]|uniref:LPS assembly lipoprotein LptE n=1 Tax=Sediminimonas sp. TaxID=2823379 RepID=UPI0025DAF760|nr:LPS assembly lipoprotein LptE [Sediminimonas sp.]
MWWSDRRNLLAGMGAALALALAGCGFAPVYGPQGAGDRLQSAVHVQAPDSRDEQLLTRRIEERLGRGSRYRLRYDLDITEESLAIDANNTASRMNLVGAVSFALYPGGAVDEDAAPLIEGRTTAFTGYSATGSTVATRAAERDARVRLATILADRMIVQLVAAAGDLPE